jgi:hypothetical protein
MAVHLDADSEGVYADIHIRAEEGPLLKAGFEEAGRFRLRLPRQLDPFDAMLVVEYAIDLLGAADMVVTLDRRLTTSLESSDPPTAHDPDLHATATLAATLLGKGWESTPYDYPLLAPMRAWPSRSIRQPRGNGAVLGGIRHEELTGPRGIRLMLAQPAETRQITITASTPDGVRLDAPLPEGHRLGATLAAVYPEDLAEAVQGMLPAYESAAHRARLLLLGELRADLGSISTAWEITMESLAGSNSLVSGELRTSARRHRDRTAWAAVESASVALRPALEYSRHLVAEQNLELDDRAAWHLDQLGGTVDDVGRQLLGKWTKDNKAKTFEAQLRARQRRGAGAWPVAESLLVHLPVLHLIAEATESTSARAKAARSVIQRSHPSKAVATLVERWRAATAGRPGRHR